jgi:four helix bundle protein
MNEAELKKRTKRFALRVMKLVSALPENSVGRAIASQLMRCATSVGANYRAACRGRSKAEFIAKPGIVIEEADESGYWLELVIESELIHASRVEELLDEANQITAIMVASRKSTIENQQSKI